MTTASVWFQGCPIAAIQAICDRMDIVPNQPQGSWQPQAIIDILGLRLKVNLIHLPETVVFRNPYRVS